MSATIAQALAAACDRLQTSDSPQLDAEVLLAHVLQKNRTHLRTWPEQALTPDQLQRYQDLIEKRQSGIPVAYLTGEREFWKHRFQVNPSVLIPRPDTELLVEQALVFAKRLPKPKIADLGTGSGAIAVSLALDLPHAEVHATDRDRNALAVARQNATVLHAEQIQFHLGDWCDALEPRDFDLIVSNPPYIAPDDQHLCEGDVRFEPPSALIAPQRGLADIQRITAEARSHLRPGGRLMLEHGYDQSEEVAHILLQCGYTAIESFPDLQGHLRICSGQA